MGLSTAATGTTTLLDCADRENFWTPPVILVVDIAGRHAVRAAWCWVVSISIRNCGWRVILNFAVPKAMRGAAPSHRRHHRLSMLGWLPRD